MTLDQVLLSGLLSAAIAGVIIALFRHRMHARWRRKDLLREFITRWGGEVGVPTEVDAVRFEEEHLRFGIDLRLPAEKEAYFAPAFKLAPKSVRQQHEEFIEARLAYIKGCHKLYEQIEQLCVERAGLQVGHWREERDWPKRVLLPNFVLTIYEQALGLKHNTVRLEDISYSIGPFSHSGRGFERKGLHLATTYNAYHGLALAQADDEATLQHVRSIHRQMMETDYSKRFAAEVERVSELRKKAEILAREVRDSLRKLEVS